MQLSPVVAPDAAAHKLAVQTPDGAIWYAGTDAGSRRGHLNVMLGDRPYAVINPMDLFITVDTTNAAGSLNFVAKEKP